MSKKNNKKTQNKVDTHKIKTVKKNEEKLSVEDVVMLQDLALYHKL